MEIPKDIKELQDRDQYRDMVHWFSPGVLWSVIQKVVASTLFAQYADRRLVHASLDVIDPEKIIDQCCGGPDGICGSANPEIWLDYVADLGDGFDSTYAMAYLIGGKSIRVEGQELPRANCLIMGGDEVYPDASRADYERRMQRPYMFAFPNSSRPDAVHPTLFLIPGNHDWYDGLTLFLAKFCQGRPTSLGSWRTQQSRSYFAIQLAMNWWIWGFDSQLGDDIDRPQSEYFVNVAKKMKPNAKVIICASVPSWLKADIHAAPEEERNRYYRSLDYIANIVRNECVGSKVPLVISGDLHHYSRFVAKESGTTFITAGGGGAFLHPTHHLPDKLDTKFAMTEETLESDMTAPTRKRNPSIRRKRRARTSP